MIGIVKNAINDVTAVRDIDNATLPPIFFVKKFEVTALGKQVIKTIPTFTSTGKGIVNAMTKPIKGIPMSCVTKPK